MLTVHDTDFGVCDACMRKTSSSVLCFEGNTQLSRHTSSVSLPPTRVVLCQILSGMVGTLLVDDGSDKPFHVEAPNAVKWWYSAEVHTTVPCRSTVSL